jgi:hypothetical protein
MLELLGSKRREVLAFSVFSSCLRVDHEKKKERITRETSFEEQQLRLSRSFESF